RRRRRRFRRWCARHALVARVQHVRDAQRDRDGEDRRRRTVEPDGGEVAVAVRHAQHVRLAGDRVRVGIASVGGTHERIRHRDRRAVHGCLRRDADRAQLGNDLGRGGTFLRCGSGFGGGGRCSRFSGCSSSLRSCSRFSCGSSSLSSCSFFSSYSSNLGSCSCFSSCSSSLSSSTRSLRSCSSSLSSSTRRFRSRSSSLSSSSRSFRSRSSGISSRSRHLHHRRGERDLRGRCQSELRAGVRPRQHTLELVRGEHGRRRAGREHRHDLAGDRRAQIVRPAVRRLLVRVPPGVRTDERAAGGRCG
uniref:Uncharacterized protein n=1 Tax=Anopheles dirus TaxID=7168 RepID=A0A182NW45_9DIPT